MMFSSADTHSVQAPVVVEDLTMDDLPATQPVPKRRPLKKSLPSVCPPIRKRPRIAVMQQPVPPAATPKVHKRAISKSRLPKPSPQAPAPQEAKATESSEEDSGLSITTATTSSSSPTSSSGTSPAADVPKPVPAATLQHKKSKDIRIIIPRCVCALPVFPPSAESQVFSHPPSQVYPSNCFLGGSLDTCPVAVCQTRCCRKWRHTPAPPRPILGGTLPPWGTGWQPQTLRSCAQRGGENTP